MTLQQATWLYQPVTTLTGIGEDIAQRLQKLDIYQLQDFLFHLPLRYENRTEYCPIGSLSVGQKVLISGQIQFTDILRRKRRMMICRIHDGTGWIDLRFFHFSTKQFEALKIGGLLSCFGVVRQGYAGLEMVHPEYRQVTEIGETTTEHSLTPVYPLTEGIRQNSIKKWIFEVLDACLQQPELLVDSFPTKLLTQYQYPSLLQALENLHRPSENPPSLENSPYLNRLVFEELTAHALSMQTHKQQGKTWEALVFRVDSKLKQRFLDSLPFQLTAAQHRVIADIEKDCAIAHPMLRLVQGDVGSGKTLVAAVAALLALANNAQVAIMSPTELLAEQHYRNFSNWFSNLGYSVVFLSSQTKGKQRQQLLHDIETGKASIILGTHALFQEAVQFNNLGLIIIDEQHRFGVHQRLALRSKGEKGNRRPHQLVMTATPIPRTLAMLNYADLDISVIDELPAGRKAITTRMISAERRLEVIERLKNWLNQQHQGYWVCPFIEESETFQCEAVTTTAQQLSYFLPEARIAVVHGKMKAQEKETVMQAFIKHELDLLVATTVIEVGVDVPNANLMIIENPERLGLAQLHQLRGRVGRGGVESFCLLLYQSPLAENTRLRLQTIRDLQDGFLIAEQDLKLRGAGELMGTKQTGAKQFKLVDMSRDYALLNHAQQAAQIIFQNHPESIKPLIKRWLGHCVDYAEV